MPINFIVTDGSYGGCIDIIHLIENINTKLVLADRAYDTNEILSYLNKRNISPVIPPKSNRFYQ